jgi:TolB-like protein/Tfp pilus assembly protein PilF
LLYCFDDYTLDTDRRELRRDAGLVSVEPKVFDLLAHLVRNHEHVVSKDDLIAAIWGGRVVSDSALSTCINAARCAIGDSGEAQRLIKTLRHKGIRFVGTVRGEQQRAGVAVTDTIAEPPRPAFALPDKPSIAVLPFTNMSDDPGQDYFADGMAEEIITALSRCSWLFVIARNSSFTYKGRSVDVRQIGRELGVRYVLEGSVRRAGNRLRFTGQLVDATSGAYIWADRFEGEISDVFDLQDRMSESVVGAIEPKLQFAEIDRVKRKPAANLDAYDLFLRALQLEYEFTEQSLAAALRCLEQALAIDPYYVPALGLAAYCYVERRVQGWEQDLEAEAAEGLRLAVRAADLARDDANVLWMAAYAGRSFGMDPDHAKELFNRSLYLNPNSAMALAAAGWNEAVLANPEGALELLRRAERLSPRDPRAWLMAAHRAFAHFVAGQFKDAAALAKKALAQNPRSARALRLLAASLARLGEREQAAAAIRELLAIDPQQTISKVGVHLRHWPESGWNNYAEALRLAGLPE